MGICRPSCPLPAQHEAGHPARMATAAPGRARRLPARGTAGGEGGGRQVLVRGARSSFIHRVPNGARNRSGPLSPPAAQDVAPCARSPAGTAHAAGAAGLSTAQLASVVTWGRGWQRALRGSRPAPARRRLGALRESRGSPDLPKVAGTSIRRARAHGNRPGRASARLAAGPGSGTAGPRAVTLQKTGVAEGWHPGEPPPIPPLQHAALGAGTQPLRILCCLVHSCPFPRVSSWTCWALPTSFPSTPASLAVCLGLEIPGTGGGFAVFICVLGGSPACLPAGAQLCERQIPNIVNPINLLTTLAINICAWAGGAAVPGETPAPPSGGAEQTLGTAGLARPQRAWDESPGTGSPADWCHLPRAAASGEAGGGR